MISQIKKLFFCLFFLLILSWCTSGHALTGECECFPHDDFDTKWSKIEGHGVWAIENGADPYCTECHGSDLTGGWSNVSCYQCHPSYPHTPTWEEPNKHGVYTVNNGLTDNCQNACHGEDYKGGYSQINCYDCHELYPHKDNWHKENVNPTNQSHGPYVMNNDAIKTRVCATECHGKSYDGGLSGSSCFGCHQSYPHAFNWSSPDSHGIYGVTFGVEENCSTGCHGTDYEGGQTEISCKGCHESFPHEENTLANHPTEFEAVPFVNCATQCHGTNLKGGLSGAANCNMCHVDWSPIPTPQKAGNLAIDKLYY